VTALASRTDVRFRSATEISGRLTDAGGAPLAGQVVALEQNPFPYRAFRAVEHTTTAPDGTYHFVQLVPDRNTRYRVSAVGAPSVVSAPLLVLVEPSSVTHLYTLRFGQLMATLIAYHAKAFNWSRRTAYWFVAARGSRHFQLVAVTHTRELGPGVTYATANFYPPKGRFAYRVCFNAPGELGLGAPGVNHSCPNRDFKVARPVA
jgi:hypothetical protein